MIDKKELLNLIDVQFPLHKKDIKEMSKVKVFPMSFEIEQYEAEGLGNVSFMQAKGLLGLMKMDTMVINPFEVDAPLHSYDYIDAMGNITLLEDMFDTRINKEEYNSEITKITSDYENIQKAEVESKWYDALRLPQSLFIKGKKKQSEQFDKIVLDFTKAYLKDCKNANKCDRVLKMKEAHVYTEGLLNNGGPSTDLFVKKLGLDFTTKLFEEVLFATKTPDKGE